MNNLINLKKHHHRYHQINSHNKIEYTKKFLYLLLFSSSLISSIKYSYSKSTQIEQDSNNQYHILFRFKRQLLLDQSSGSQSTRPTSSDANQVGGSLSSTSQNNPQDGSIQDGEKAPEEALANLKCDFGTSDAPDICKFKVLDNPNPLSKGASSWTHGSGKLALYQGGPLIDASASNDTTGGYIFYETSNPFAGSPMPSHQTTTFSMNSGPDHSSYDLTTTSVTADPYQAHHKPASQRNKDHQSTIDSFQRVSSGRIAVGPPVSSSGLMGFASLVSGPAFVSPNLTAPGLSGMCLSFKYAIQGLSADELRIHVNDHKTDRSRLIWSSSESAANNWTSGEVLYSVTSIHSIIFSASSGANGGQSNLKDIQQQKKFRGYLALDDIEVAKHDSSGETLACRGHCNFDGDLCGWTNAENGQEDDFDWSFGRGSENLFTGPARDFISSTNNDLTGSYLYTDSSYPRRPGDRATLLSPMFPATATNEAMCMRLAVHMFGSGIGSLAIKIRYSDAEAAIGPSALGGNSQSTAQAGNQAPANQAANNFQPGTGGGRSAEGKPGANDMTIWEMSGDAGNSWHQAQTSVSSSKSPFQVVVEGLIGDNHLGNIAIDEISFSPGPCPTSPPVASKNVGDCTFEQSMCYWRNPDADMHLDDLDWIKSADEQSIHGPNFDHTLKKRSGSYLKLENTLKEPKSGTRAFLLSPIFQPKASGNVQCLSFYYYMFMRSISPSGPNLGTIRVYLASNSELLPIWRLTNPISSPSWKHARASLSNALVDGVPQAPTKMFQIAFEGIWGDAPGGAIALDDITIFDGACDIMPAEAKSVPGECTFDVDLCSWINKTNIISSNSMPPQDAGTSAASPFLQSVSSGTAASGYGGYAGSPSKAMISSNLNNNNNNIRNNRVNSWQLATVDVRPVNLQDHTYKAPIGYVYVDVLESGPTSSSSLAAAGGKISYVLQSAETTVQQGQQQVIQCLSFWFAAFGRQDTNQLSVYLSQASAPPPTPGDDSSNAPSATNQTNPEGSEGGDNANAWRQFDGKMLWSVSLRNLTENNRRKWQYGQTTLRADSNYIVRFVAQSSDGGFALDDISYYEGGCETRPGHARILSIEEEEENIAAGAAGGLGGGSGGGGLGGPGGAGGANSGNSGANSGGGSAGGGSSSQSKSSGNSGGASGQVNSGNNPLN